MREIDYYYWLSNLQDIGIKRVNALLDYYKTPENIYNAKERDLLLISALTAKNRETILNSDMKELAKKSYDKLQQKGIYFVTKDNPMYPSKLRNIYDSPIALYVKGNLPKEEKKTLAIVGARNCTNYGKELAKYFAKELAGKGIQVISGLARGIDSFAHMGALETGSTYGVLGCGIDICYPVENIELFMEMQINGGIISEYGLGIPAKPGLFPMRNRIISGISDGILIIEAKEKSGSLITVDFGLEQGKDIYAIPGRITDVLSNGCNNLIKMGAKLVSSVDDILEDLVANYDNMCLDNYYDSSNDSLVEGCGKYKNINNHFEKSYKQLETKEKIVYDMLSLNPKHLEQIMIDTTLDRNILMEVLINLQLKNFVKQVGNNYYVLSSECK